MERVAVRPEEIDDASAGKVALDVDLALEDLGLQYEGLDDEGELRLQAVTDATASLSDDELTAALSTALDSKGLVDRLGVRSFSIGA